MLSWYTSNSPGPEYAGLHGLPVHPGPVICSWSVCMFVSVIVLLYMEVQVSVFESLISTESPERKPPSPSTPTPPPLHPAAESAGRISSGLLRAASGTSGSSTSARASRTQTQRRLPILAVRGNSLSRWKFPQAKISRPISSKRQGRESGVVRNEPPPATADRNIRRSVARQQQLP